MGWLYYVIIVVVSFTIGYIVGWVQRVFDKPKSRPKADVPRFKANDLVDLTGAWDDMRDPDLRRGLERMTWPARVLYTYRDLVALNGLYVPTRYLKLHTKP